MDGDAGNGGAVNVASEGLPERTRERLVSAENIGARAVGEAVDGW